MFSPALIVPLSFNRFPNQLATKVSNNILRNPPFCYFASFFIVSLTPYLSKPDSPRDSIIFIISFISSLKVINVVLPDPSNFLRVAASVVDVAAVNLIGIKIILASSLNTFRIEGNPVFGNGSKSLPRNPPDYLMLCN